jgi:endonuclease-3 related protein
MKSTPPPDSGSKVRAYYEALLREWGPQEWWPARTRFEVIVGAYLTQNTSWTNVERALRNLRQARLLTASGIRNVALERLEELVKPSGYFRQKAARLKMFVAYLEETYGGSTTRMFAQPTERLRGELLALNGVGPETADSILLYAGNHAVFVIDAYTRRILDRHKILAADRPYEEARRLMEHALEESTQAGSTQTMTGDARGERQGVRPSPHGASAMSRAKRPELIQRYNEMHALIVAVGKDHCFKSKPNCDGCPLKTFLPEPGLPNEFVTGIGAVRELDRL